MQVADDVAVLYLGQMVAQVKAEEVTRAQVVELITTGTSGEHGNAAPSNNGGI
jgi:D-xylose transport system ATP-binding protein